MTTNEVQDTLLNEKELKVKVIRDALHVHKLWFKDGKIMPRYLTTLLALLDEYENKEARILARHNLAGSVEEYE
jgi:hypothetical protein|tara:strand:+ start:407 stop:628 length:222 start_codon:yes stop_codon:yes gene_type:complete